MRGSAAKCVHGQSAMFRSVLGHDEDFDRVFRITKCLSFGRQKKQKRPGGIFRVSPWGPQNSSHPPQRKSGREGNVRPPYLRGQKGAVNKRMNETVTGKRQISCGKQEKGRAFATKADGKKCRPLFMNYNFSSLSRARKFYRASPAKFFALFLDKMSEGQKIPDKSAAPARVNALAGAAMGRVGGAHMK